MPVVEHEVNVEVPCTATICVNADVVSSIYINPPATVEEELVTDIELKVTVDVPVTYKAPPY